MQSATQKVNEKSVQNAEEKRACSSPKPVLGAEYVVHGSGINNKVQLPQGGLLEAYTFTAYTFTLYCYQKTCNLMMEICNLMMVEET